MANKSYAGYSQNRRKRKKKKHGALFAPLSFIIICAALVFGMSVFFRVSKVEAIGSDKYSEAEIIEASGIEPGDNLFFLNRLAAISRIRSKLSYIEEVKITRSLPNKILINVSESRLIASIIVDGEVWAIDKKCKILDYLGSVDNTGGYFDTNLINIVGLEPSSPETASELTGDDAQKARITYLTDILSSIQNRGLEDQITEIDMSNLTNPSFDFTGRFFVKLGKTENTQYKFDLLVSAVARLSPGDVGTIDLSVDRKAHFSPG